MVAFPPSSSFVALLSLVALVAVDATPTLHSNPTNTPSVSWNSDGLRLQYPNKTSDSPTSYVTFFPIN